MYMSRNDKQVFLDKLVHLIQFFEKYAWDLPVHFHLGDVIHNVCSSCALSPCLRTATPLIV